ARLGRLWCTGVRVPWADLYTDPKPGRDSLPLYPFARERCWITPVEPASHPSTMSAVVSDDDLDGLVFRQEWVPIPTLGQARGDEHGPVETSSVIVYLPDSSAAAEALQKVLGGGLTYEIRLGTRTQLRSERGWEVDLDDADGITNCLVHIE